MPVPLPFGFVVKKGSKMWRSVSSLIPTPSSVIVEGDRRPVPRRRACAAAGGVRLTFAASIR